MPQHLDTHTYPHPRSSPANFTPKTLPRLPLPVAVTTTLGEIHDGLNSPKMLPTDIPAPKPPPHFKSLHSTPGARCIKAKLTASCSFCKPFLSPWVLGQPCGSSADLDLNTSHLHLSLQSPNCYSLLCVTTSPPQSKLCPTSEFFPTSWPG